MASRTSFARLRSIAFTREKAVCKGYVVGADGELHCTVQKKPKTRLANVSIRCILSTKAMNDRLTSGSKEVI